MFCLSRKIPKNISCGKKKATHSTLKMSSLKDEGNFLRNCTFKMKKAIKIVSLVAYSVCLFKKTFSILKYSIHLHSNILQLKTWFLISFFIDLKNFSYKGSHDKRNKENRFKRELNRYL